MLYYKDKPVELHFPLASLAASEAEQLKLPSLLEPEKLRKRHAFKWLYVGMLAEYPAITLAEVKKAFRGYSKDELLRAVYDGMAVDMNSKDSLQKLSEIMEEVK